jgi:hypothetical protein
LEHIHHREIYNSHTHLILNTVLPLVLIYCRHTRINCWLVPKSRPLGTGFPPPQIQSRVNSCSIHGGLYARGAGCYPRFFSSPFWSSFHHSSTLIYHRPLRHAIALSRQHIRVPQVFNTEPSYPTRDLDGCRVKKLVLQGHCNKANLIMYPSEYTEVVPETITFSLKCFKSTYLRSSALLDKLPNVQLLKNFPEFYGIRRFITVFTRVLH